MLEKRENRIRALIDKRQLHFSVILENVRDPHNIGAVMRTCDAVGIHEIFLIYSNPDEYKQFVLGKRASSGARKWVDVYEFESVKSCMDYVRSKGYKKIWATKMDAQSKILYDIDFTDQVALLFGNEHFGVSDEAAGYADGNFLIPQMGMVQSLNISVACAVSLYEGLRQRMSKGLYDTPSLPSDFREEMFKVYEQREMFKIKGRSSIKLK